jgi:hypothetical protein
MVRPRSRSSGHLILKRFGADVEHDLMTIAAAHGLAAVGHEALSDHAERIGAARAGGQFNRRSRRRSLLVRFRSYGLEGNASTRTPR